MEIGQKAPQKEYKKTAQSPEPPTSTGMHFLSPAHPNTRQGGHRKVNRERGAFIKEIPEN